MAYIHTQAPGIEERLTSKTNDFFLKIKQLHVGPRKDNSIQRSHMMRNRKSAHSINRRKTDYKKLYNCEDNYGFDDTNYKDCLKYKGLLGQTIDETLYTHRIPLWTEIHVYL